MRKFTTLSALLIVAVFAAKADTVYTLNFASASLVGGYHGSGVFDVNGSGVIDALTGTLYVGSSLTGEAMMLLLPGPTSGGLPGFAGNDNVFIDTSPYFDIFGFAFTAGTTPTTVDGFSYPGTPYDVFGYTTNTGYGSDVTGCILGHTCIANNIYGTSSVLVNFEIAPAVPEPATFLLMGSSVLLGIGFLRHQRKTR